MFSEMDEVYITRLLKRIYVDVSCAVWLLELAEMMTEVDLGFPKHLRKLTRNTTKTNMFILRLKLMNINLSSWCLHCILYYSKSLVWTCCWYLCIVFSQAQFVLSTESWRQKSFPWTCFITVRLYNDNKLFLSRTKTAGLSCIFPSSQWCGNVIWIKAPVTSSWSSKSVQTCPFTFLILGHECMSGRVCVVYGCDGGGGIK